MKHLIFAFLILNAYNNVFAMENPLIIQLPSSKELNQRFWKHGFAFLEENSPFLSHTLGNERIDHFTFVQKINAALNSFYEKNKHIPLQKELMQSQELYLIKVILSDHPDVFKAIEARKLYPRRISEMDPNQEL